MRRPQRHIRARRWRHDLCRFRRPRRLLMLPCSRGAGREQRLEAIGVAAADRDLPAGTALQDFSDGGEVAGGEEQIVANRASDDRDLI